MSFNQPWFWQLVIPLALAAALGWVLSYPLTRLSVRLALRFGVVARPNNRTSHEGVVPRIGGIGLAGSFLLAVAGVGIWMWVNRSLGSGGEVAGVKMPPPLLSGFVKAILIGGTGAFLLGLWDDVRSLPATVKLVVQVLLALVPSLLGVRLMRVGLPGMGPWPLPMAIGAGAAFLWVLFWMNAYNFMDGINGIAGRFGEVLALALLLITVGILQIDCILAAFLVGACFGFLLWNAPTARTFMGDCGSQFLGYLFAVWTLHLAAEFKPVRAVFPAMIALTLPFSWDVVYTLIRRALRGENLLKAHRSHLYQRLMTTGFSHDQTLAVVEKTFYACAVAAILLVRFSTARNAALQWGSLAFSVLALIAYTLYVHRREREVVPRASDRPKETSQWPPPNK